MASCALSLPFIRRWPTLGSKVANVGPSGPRIWPGHLQMRDGRLVLQSMNLRLLGERTLHRLFHFSGRELLDVCRERPFVAERIADHAVAVSPKHVCRRHQDRGPGVLGAFDRGIAILNIVMEGYRRAF